MLIRHWQSIKALQKINWSIYDLRGWIIIRNWKFKEKLLEFIKTSIKKWNKNQITVW